MEAAPVFIAGVSFSGKTQLRLMLSAHPQFIITRRTFLWRRYNQRFGDLSRSENLERCLDAVLALPAIQAFNPDRQRILQAFANGQPGYPRLFSLIHQQYADSLGKKYWGHQQGFIESEADFIFETEPSARFLHMVRHPFERIAESLSDSTHRQGKVGWETALWQASSRWALRNHARYPERYRIIHWEDLLANPEATLRQVCAFLEEEYHPAVLSEGGLAGQPASKSRPDGSLTLTGRSFVQSWAGQEMTSLGYMCGREQMAVKDRLLYTLRDYPLNSAGALLYIIMGRKKTDQS